MKSEEKWHVAWFFKHREQPSPFAALDGKLITYAVRREANGEIVIGKDGRICRCQQEYGAQTNTEKFFHRNRLL